LAYVFIHVKHNRYSPSLVKRDTIYAGGSLQRLLLSFIVQYFGNKQDRIYYI